ncbi:MAG: hypothetical protein ACRDQY_02480 [Pseudonocardiaceae bacterium]
MAGRVAARDLYDLCALAQIGAIDERAVDLFVRYEPTSRSPSEHRFEHPPDETRWRRGLAGQVQLGLTAVDAFEQVRLAWRRAIGQQ